MAQHFAIEFVPKARVMFYDGENFNDVSRWLADFVMEDQHKKFSLNVQTGVYVIVFLGEVTIVPEHQFVQMK